MTLRCSSRTSSTSPRTTIHTLTILGRLSWASVHRMHGSVTAATSTIVHICACATFVVSLASKPTLAADTPFSLSLSLPLSLSLSLSLLLYSFSLLSSSSSSSLYSTGILLCIAICFSLGLATLPIPIMRFFFVIASFLLTLTHSYSLTHICSISSFQRSCTRFVFCYAALIRILLFAA